MIKDLYKTAAAMTLLSGLDTSLYSEHYSSYSSSDTFESRGWNGEIICTGKHKQKRKGRRK